MKDLAIIFWKANLTDLKRGYVYDAPSKSFICLVCGECFLKGRIFAMDDLFYEAEKATQIHIDKAHSGMFEFLLNMNKRYTGLTDHQKELLTAFYQGLSDKTIANRMANTNTSTVRNQRFALREKAKQAKVFLALMELLGEAVEEAKEFEGTAKTGIDKTETDQFIEIPRTAMMVDERFAITEAENEQILKIYFKEGREGPLDRFPKQEKRKVAILKHLMQRFELQQKYTEKEVNEILQRAYPDYVTLRRYLIEYGFMDRHVDGSFYWIKN